jgi:hypothetical protein
MRVWEQNSSLTYKSRIFLRREKHADTQNILLFAVKILKKDLYIISIFTEGLWWLIYAV